MADFLVPKNQNLRLTRYDYRLTYSKTGIARYISQLDMMRSMQRAFKRARIPIWYTQGFNPHAYLNFPLALPLGTDSEIEVLDVALLEELEFGEIVSRINEKMPEGLWIVKADKPLKKHTEIALARYDIAFDCVGVSADEVMQKLELFLQNEKIEVEKRSKKRGINLVDIKPHIDLKSIEADDMVNLDIILPAGGEFNLNTSVVMEAFCKYEGVEIGNIYTTRTKIMCKNGEDFI